MKWELAPSLLSPFSKSFQKLSELVRPELIAPPPPPAGPGLGGERGWGGGGGGRSSEVPGWELFL